VVKYRSFNLNQYIKVKIKYKGYLHLYKEDMQLHHNYPSFKVKSIEDRKAKEDENGYITMQAHEFITNFSMHGFDLPSYIDINILIEDNNDN